MTDITDGNSVRIVIETHSHDYFYLVPRPMCHNPNNSTFVKSWHEGSNISSFIRIFTPRFNMFCDMIVDMATGKTLDVGAGSGCHSLVLQEKGIDVTAIDISPLSVETI